MEVVLSAGRVTTNSGDEIKMTENTTMNEAIEKIGSFGFDSRDRRKSKYLSYPYTNMGPRHKDLPAETEDLRTPYLSHKAETSSTMLNALNRTPSVAKAGSKSCLSHKEETSSTTKNALNRTPSVAKLGSKRFRRSWHRKFISCSAIPHNKEFINASSAELLAGLYLTAVDCMFPMEDKNFDLVEWFFCRYRVSEYHDEAELATSQDNVKGGKIGKPVDNNLQDSKTEKRRKYNQRENTARRKMKSLSGLSDVNMSSSTSDCLRPGGKLKQKRKVEEVTPSQQLPNVEITLNESNGKHSSVPEVPQISTCDSLGPGGKLNHQRKVEEVTPLQQLQNAEITLIASNDKHGSVLEVPQISTSDSPGLRGKLRQKRKVEEVTPLQQPQSVEITLNVSNGKHSSVPEVPQISTSNTLRPWGKQKRKVEEVTPLQQPQNVEITLNGSISKHSLVPEVPQSMTFFASEKGRPKRRKKVEAAPEYLSAQNASANSDTKITKCSSLVIDLQLSSPSIPGPILQKSNGENKEEQVLTGSNPASCVSQEGRVGKFTNHGLSSSTTSDVSAVLVTETGLKGNKMEKVAEGYLSNKLAAEIPDLNCTISESNSISREYDNVNMLQPQVKSEQPRILSVCERPTEITNCSGVMDNGEAVGACLLLRFAPGVPLPSREDLMATFFRFGPLKASESKLLKDTNSAQIVFVRSADATEAFRSLEQNKPFGAALVDYKLHHLSAACPTVEHFMTPTQPTRSTASTPMRGVAHPPLHIIKQNLQMMASMLENSGNNLSPETRAKLDSELKNLLKRVNSRSGSSLQKSER